MIEFLTSNYFGIIIGLISLIISIYTLVKDLPAKSTYTTMTKCFINDNISQYDKISLKYDGEDIPRFSITTLVFWNGGKKSLKKDDYKGVTPKITAKGDYRILDYSKLDVCSDDNFVNFEFLFENNELTISFDRIRKNQGFAIEILHTGETSKDLSIDFKFSEAESQYVFSAHKSNKGLFNKIIVSLSYFLASVILINVTILFYICGKTLWGIFFTIYTIIILFGISYTITRFFAPYLGVPKRFHKFLDNIDDGNE